MRLSAFVALGLGMALEILQLWERARQSNPQRNPRMMVIGPVTLSRERLLMGVLIIVALLLIGVGEVTGFAGHEVYMGEGPVDMIFILLGLGLFYYGLLDPFLLPHVNEQTALAVHVTVALGLLLERPFEMSLWGYIALLGLPTLLLVYLGLTRRAPPAAIRALVYLWYLLELLTLTLQNDFTSITQYQPTPPSLAEEFVTGTTAIFLLLHSFFLVRFVLMTSTLIVPRGRHYMKLAIPKLFSDEQLLLWQFLLMLGLVVLVFVLNTFFDVVPNTVVLNVLVLVVAQGLPRILPVQR